VDAGEDLHCWPRESTTMEVTQSVFNAKCRGEDADMGDIVYDLSLGRG
jgi:hypothetical protein